jgi:hypothetical protein
MRKCESTKEDVFVDCLALLRPFVLSRFRGENSLDLIVGVAVALPPRDGGLWRVGQQHGCFSNSWTSVSLKHARLRAFPHQRYSARRSRRVSGTIHFYGCCFSLSRSFTGVLDMRLKPRASRRLVNGPDNNQGVFPSSPGVNAGPNTGFGGKGRERPSSATRL